MPNTRQSKDQFTKCNSLGARPSTDTSGQKRQTPSGMPTALAKAIVTVPLRLAISHPKLMKKYALPLALSTFSTPLLSFLPIGPLAPMLAFVAVACGRFNLRRELIGGGYALLHAAGMAGVKGQALSLLGLVGLEATGSQKLRDTVVRTVIESNVGIRAQVVGLAIAVLFSATGVLGTLGSMLGARSMSLLFSELRSFAMFHGLKWGASNLQVLWATLCTSSDALKVAFLEHVLGKRNGKPGTKVDDQKRAQWARGTLEKVAARIPQLPVEAIAPELAAILKAWDQEKIAEGSHEAIDEWVEIDRNDEDLWASISYNKHEEMEISSANIASYVDKSILGKRDFTHRPSHVEDTQYLEQVACKTFQKPVVRGQGECATLDNMAWKARPAAPWRMEVEEPDSDDEFGSVNVDGNDEDDIEVIDLGDL